MAGSLVREHLRVRGRERYVPGLLKHSAHTGPGIRSTYTQMLARSLPVAHLDMQEFLTTTIGCVD